ncbi:MAG: peptidoglycan-binding protein [Phycisphaerae bacterium]
MSDAPDSTNSAFDSFTGRLGKVLKTVSRAPTPAPAPDDPVPTDGPSPFDSFAQRLDSARTKEGTDPLSPAAPDDAVQPASALPVGSGAYVVRQGECISSIAGYSGHFWETLWNDPANADLRAARVDPNVLLPGDRVHVPALREKWESRPTEQRHRFRRRGLPEMFRVRVLRDGEPRGNLPYTLTIDGRETTGVTDANGNLSQPIAPNAKRAVLVVGSEPDVDRYEFALGAIDPIESISGVQGRLNNLGFDCGPIDGIWGPRSESAMRDYQRSRNLDGTGRPDEATRRQLQADYGC